MAASMENMFNESLEKFSLITQNPEDFVTEHAKHADSLTQTLKCIYDQKKAVDSSKSSKALSELIVDSFDDEQVWQQLELENGGLLTDLVSKVARILADKTQCTFASSSTIKSDLFSNKDKVKISKKLSKKKKKENISEVSELQEDIDDNIEKAEDEDEIRDSDEEMQKIQSRLGMGDSEESEDEDQEDDQDDLDPNDKFFDFTGDSDEDLNYDIGPLSKKGDLDENIFEGDEKSMSKKGNKKGKKSVTFKDEVEEGLGLNDEEDMFDTPSKNKGESKTVKGLVNKIRKKGSIVDDKFFKLYEMEAFLNLEDKREERKNRKTEFGENEDESSDEEEDDVEIDMFGGVLSDEETYHYDDFFDDVEDNRKAVNKRGTGKEELEDDNDDGDREEEEEEEEEEEHFGGEELGEPNRRRRDLLADSESEGEDAEEILGHKPVQKSTFEIRQEKLKKRISSMEEASLADKPWQLTGEVESRRRPENSLLQENLQFELTSRLAPEITEETTLTLEQLIKQRVKDRSWDDVERKVKPKENVTEYKKRITLDQEKSKQSLGEIYEQEYLKQQEKEKEEEDEPVHKDHDEIKKMMQSLFIKLDALSNFHYTPKQAMPEVKIVADQPSISMEEVAPVTVSDQKMLAPQEIQEKQQGELKGDTEKTKTDKQSERRKKKSEKRKKVQEKAAHRKQIEKLNPGLGNKYSKEKALKQLEKDSKAGKNNLTMIKDNKDKSKLTSSKAFFTQLQDEVKASIKSKTEGKRKKDSDHAPSAKKYKL